MNTSSTNRIPARQAACIGLLVVIGCLGSRPAYGDQHAPELSALFAALGSAADSAAAHVVEQEIWALWFNAPAVPAASLFERGRKAVEAGDLQEGITLFDQLTREFPDFAEGWNQRAIVHFLLDDMDGALADVAKTLALEPRHFGALSGRGQCYLRLERPREALTAFDATLQIDPWLDTVAQQATMLRAYVERQPTPI